MGKTEGRRVWLVLFDGGMGGDGVGIWELDSCNISFFLVAFFGILLGMVRFDCLDRFFLAQPWDKPFFHVRHH